MFRRLLILSVFLPLLSHGQRTADIGFATGIVNYIGDLANEKKFPYSSASPGVQLTLRNFLNNPEHSHVLYNPLSLEFRLSWHRLQYDETHPLDGLQGHELRNYLRGLNFRNDLFGAAVNVTYTLYKSRVLPLSRQGVVFYLLAGVGTYYGKPKADLFHGDANLSNRYYFWNDGTIHDVDESSGLTGNVIEKDGVYESDLSKWKTEAEGIKAEGDRRKSYSNFNVGFPLGLGARYALNRMITLSAELDYYYFLTDYLDDVSTRYATYDELHQTFQQPEQFELAKYISDPTGRGTDGTTGIHTSRRGNPSLKDSFTFFNIEVAYHFTLSDKEIYGQSARR